MDYFYWINQWQFWYRKHSLGSECFCMYAILIILYSQPEVWWVLWCGFRDPSLDYDKTRTLLRCLLGEYSTRQSDTSFSGVHGVVRRHCKRSCCSYIDYYTSTYSLTQQNSDHHLHTIYSVIPTNVLKRGTVVTVFLWAKQGISWHKSEPLAWFINIERRPASLKRDPYIRRDDTWKDMLF